MDRIAPTPRNRVLGLLADTLAELEEKAKSVRQPNPLMMVPSLLGGQTPQTAILNLLGVPALQKTVERMSYGEPLTTGSGMTTKPRQETTEAALLAAGIAGPAAKAGEKAAMAVGKAGERLAERAVPAVMERGGLPAEMMQAMGQGGRSYVITPASAASQSGAVRVTKGLPAGASIKNVGSEDYLQSLRPVDVFGNGSRIDYYDDAKGIMYSAQEYPKGTRWTAYDVLPKFEGGNQVIGEMDRHRSFADVVAGVRGARISESAKARNAKYAVIPNTWSGEAKKIGKSLIDAGVEIDRVTSSTQSKSKYIYLENGKKIRISDHELPNTYDAPEFDFRYGGDIKSLVKKIKDDQVAQTFEYPQEEALRLAQQRAALPVEQGGLGLPKDNTAMDRARAMGFKESGYTGTNRDFREYDVSQAAGSGSGSREGPLGAWLTDDPRVAQSFAEWSSRGQGGDVIYPLMIRGDKPYEPSSYAKIKEILDENTKFVQPPYRMMQDKIDYAAAKKALENKGDYVALRNTMTDAIDKPITQYLVPNTSRLRSRFAAFDPKRINDPDLLASLAAFGVGLPVLGLLAEEE